MVWKSVRGRRNSLCKGLEPRGAEGQSVWGCGAGAVALGEAIGPGLGRGHAGRFGFILRATDEGAEGGLRGRKEVSGWMEVASDSPSEMLGKRQGRASHTDCGLGFYCHSSCG